MQLEAGTYSQPRAEKEFGIHPRRASGLYGQALGILFLSTPSHPAPPCTVGHGGVKGPNPVPRVTGD